jgi:hypothetical protein
MGWTCFAKPELSHKDDHAEEPSRQETTGKTAIERKDVIRKYMERLNGGRDWKTIVVDRES